MKLKKILFSLFLFLGVMVSITSEAHASTYHELDFYDTSDQASFDALTNLFGSFGVYTMDDNDQFAIKSDSLVFNGTTLSHSGLQYVINAFGDFRLDFSDTVDQTSITQLKSFFNTSSTIATVSESDDFQIKSNQLYLNGSTLNYSGLQFDIDVYKVGADTYSPVFDGETVFVTTVDDPITETQIRSYITAYDETDGDITHLIQLISDNYTSNHSTLGSYDIVYRVSDTAGNTANLTVTIMVKDVLSPTWNTAKGSASISYAQTFDIEAYKAQLGAQDNYYSSAELTISINSNTYTANKTVPGTYQVVYKILDPSDNFKLATVNITVFDDVDPVFSGASVISKATTQAMTISDIKAELTANDAIDGNLTSSIQVVSDNFTGYGNAVGSYDVEFSVTDNSGNIAYHTVTVEVYDNLPPVFHVKDGYFVSVAQSVTLSRQDFIDILEVTGQITVDGTGGIEIYTLINEYEGNENTPGIYALSFKVISLSGNESIHNMAVEVMETTDDPVDVIEETTFIDDFVQAIKDNITYVIVGLVLIISIGYGVSKMKKTKKRNKRK
jgi:hypothetical protein